MDITGLTLDAMVYSKQNRNLNYVTHFIHSFKKHNGTEGRREGTGTA